MAKPTESGAAHAADPGPVHVFKIIVNGRKHVVKQEKLSYEEVVALAVGHSADQVKLYTVTYWNGPDGSEGTLVRGQSVELIDGMAFNVTATNQS